MQFLVHEDSQNPRTVITEDGLYRYVILPKGISSSPAKCQDILENILKGILHTEIYIDNIYSTGKTPEEHMMPRKTWNNPVLKNFKDFFETHIDSKNSEKIHGNYW